ncbi:hypothetical protein [Streptomyces griseorubiginosus]|uniref:hypothetical protein n=1 Tax=Streptomyces griseorubiginosus TaxID=67304 RepID=UPI002E807A3E|nr:hypothetical protein [Streptomyces griseorubiginosus]WUB50232.1 hypothetical protein OHN19_18825 [Streptomyces griseorubiginosus]WUB58757.1 hypothetical protein OG942_18820 [Streptomyces griseorubiginosus]
MVRRCERREISTPGRAMPYDDGLPEGEHAPEHHAQHRDGTDAPDGRRTTVRPSGDEVDADEPRGSSAGPDQAGAGE